MLRHKISKKWNEFFFFHSISLLRLFLNYPNKAKVMNTWCWEICPIAVCIVLVLSFGRLFQVHVWLCGNKKTILNELILVILYKRWLYNFECKVLYVWMQFCKNSKTKNHNIKLESIMKTKSTQFETHVKITSHFPNNFLSSTLLAALLKANIPKFVYWYLKKLQWGTNEMHVEMSMHAATAIEWFMVVLLLISFYYKFSWYICLF